MKIRFKDGKSKVFTLSYDDGLRQDKRLIEIMQKNGIKGTFNINSGMFSNELRADGKGRMTKEEAVSLYSNSGMEVAVHGYKHRSLAEIDIAAATDDIITDRKELEEIFGCVIKGMAYADGSYSDKVVAMLDICGIVLIALRYKEGWIFWMLCSAIDLVLWSVLHINQSSSNSIMMIIVSILNVLLNAWGLYSFLKMSK